MILRDIIHFIHQQLDNLLRINRFSTIPLYLVPLNMIWEILIRPLNSLFNHNFNPFFSFDFNSIRNTSELNYVMLLNTC